MKKIGWTLLIMLMCAGSAFAQDDQEAGGFNIHNLWQMALAGALSTAILGKAKKGDYNFKDINLKKMGMKAIVGLIIGAVASIKGISLVESQAFLFGGDALLIGAFAVFGVDYLLRAIFKAGAVPVKKLLGIDKAIGAGDPPAAPPAPPSEPSNPSS